MLSEADKKEMQRLYEVDLQTMREIGERFGVTRQRVHQILKQMNEDEIFVSSARVSVVCWTCGRTVERARSRVRGNVGGLYCDDFCWRVYRELSSRRAKEAKSKVGQVYPRILTCGSIHFEDGDMSNTDWSNLRVFKDNGDHADYHRGLTVEPVWDGRNVK